LTLIVNYALSFNHPVTGAPPLQSNAVRLSAMVWYRSALDRHCERHRKVTEANIYKERKQKERLAVLIEERFAFFSPALPQIQTNQKQTLRKINFPNMRFRKGWIASLSLTL
jgi:hypothetical protein